MISATSCSLLVIYQDCRHSVVKPAMNDTHRAHKLSFIQMGSGDFVNDEQLGCSQPVQRSPVAADNVHFFG